MADRAATQALDTHAFDPARDAEMCPGAAWEEAKAAYGEKRSVKPLQNRKNSDGARRW